MECRDKYKRMIVKETDMWEKMSNMGKKQTDKEERVGRKREEQRYQMEEDENSIYEYDKGCLNAKQKNGTKAL